MPRPSICLIVDTCDGSGSLCPECFVDDQPCDVTPALGISRQPPQSLNKSRVEPVRQKKWLAHCKCSCANGKRWANSEACTVAINPWIEPWLSRFQNHQARSLALRRSWSTFSSSWVPNPHTADPRASLQQSYIVVCN